MKKNKGVLTIPKMEEKKVWISGYFNMYNAIVIFSEKPHLTKKGEGWEKLDYDYYDLIHPKNKQIIAGVCGLEDFQSLFPSIDISKLIQDNGNVISCEPTKLITAYLTAAWDDDKLINIDFSLDGYQYQH